MERGVRVLLMTGCCAALLHGVATTTTPATAAVPARTLLYSASAPLASDRWNALLTVPKFDPRRGTLRSVTLRLTGRVQGSAGFENLAPGPIRITQTLSALLELRRPSESTLMQLLPLARTTDVVDAYDGATDYSGGSGRTHTALAAETTRELQLVRPEDLQIFTGAGALSLSLVSRPKSGSVAPAEFEQFFTTRSSAALTVLYSYEALPTPVQSVTWSTLKLLRS